MRLGFERRQGPRDTHAVVFTWRRGLVSSRVLTGQRARWRRRAAGSVRQRADGERDLVVAQSADQIRVLRGPDAVVDPLGPEDVERLPHAVSWKSASVRSTATLR